MTAGELAELPEDSYRHELSVGLLVAEPLPSHRHDRTRRRLERLLEEFVEQRGLGEVFGEACYVLARDPDTVRGPDLSFVTTERLSHFDDARFFSGAPDLAVEILSPSNRPADMHSKIADYLVAGARLVWVVDPERRSVTTYRELLAPRVLQLGESLGGGDVLPGLSIPLDAIFPVREN